MRLGVRARMTLVYGGVFVVGAALLLAVTCLLADRAIRQEQSRASSIIAQSGTDIRSNADKARAAAHEVELMAEADRSRRKILATMLSRGTLVVGLVGSVGAGLGWTLASRRLRPLRRMTSVAGRVTPATLRQRVAPGSARDEVGQLAESFNAMLDRLNTAFEAQRLFIANASHELRTPVTTARALVEVALADPGASPQLRTLGARLLDVNQRQERTIAALLDLARANEPLHRAQRMELTDVVSSLAADAKGEADQQSITLTTNLLPAQVVGDPALVELLVINLVGNAIRHNTTGGTVWLTVRPTGSGALLTVENTGPLVSPGEVDRLFEPFRRARDRAATAPGAGLGLSIVRAVAYAHQATLSATARPEGGLRVTVQFNRPGR